MKVSLFKIADHTVLCPVIVVPMIGNVGKKYKAKNGGRGEGGTITTNILAFALTWSGLYANLDSLFLVDCVM
jgi:hypothetical protein